MKKSIFITLALFAFTTITNLIFAQNEKVVQGQHIKEAKLTCRVSTTESGCSIVFEGSPSSSTTGAATSKKGYDYYMAKSSFSVSASDNSVSEVVSPRDAASGMATGKRMHKPMAISNEIDEASTSAKGTGGGSGKVNVQDLSMTKVNVQDISFTKRCGGKTTKISCDGGDCVIPTGDCPNGDCAITADWSWGASQSGSLKRCSVDFLLEIEDGVCTKMAINEKGTGGTKSTTKK
jgi:hypothetical protein